MKKRLYKSNSDKKLCGVCGGVAEYFEIDSTIVRLGLVIFTLLGGSGIIAYIVAALVMPAQKEELSTKEGPDFSNGNCKTKKRFYNGKHT